MNIITISREFGSGGRELGKRMADLLGYDYYDREILVKIAEQQGLNTGYVERMLESGTADFFPLTFHRTLSYVPSPSSDLLVAQNKIVREIASHNRNCIIVGRNADVLLDGYKPFRVFVYADMESKLARCMERKEQNESFSEREMEKKIKQIDKNRARTKELLSDIPWGAKEGYELLLNTSGCEIKALIPSVCELCKIWFEKER